MLKPFRMRPLLFAVLAVSLAANVGLIGVLVWRSDGTVAGTEQDVEAARSPSEGETSEAGVDISNLSSEIVARLRVGDPRTLRNLLDACGADREKVRWIVTAAIRHRFEDEKIQAVQKARGGGWWKREPDWWTNPARREVEAREEAEIARLVGEYPKKEYPWQTERLNFLRPETLSEMRRLEKDYEEMRKSLPPEPWLPHEVVLHERLVEEKRRDLVALLSPEELAEFDFREAAESLGRELDKYDITDSELRAVWRAQQERDLAWDRLRERYPVLTRDPFAPAVGSADPEVEAEVARIDAAYEERLAEIIDEERKARGDREADPAFRDIERVTRKFGLERKAAESIYHMLAQVHEEGSAAYYGAVHAQHGAQVREHLAALRQDTIGQLRDRLGSNEAVELLLKEIGYRHSWLNTPAFSVTP